MVGAGWDLASVRLLYHSCCGLLFVLVLLSLVFAVECWTSGLPKGLGLALCFSSILLLDYAHFWPRLVGVQLFGIGLVVSTWFNIRWPLSLLFVVFADCG